MPSRFPAFQARSSTDSGMRNYQLAVIPPTEAHFKVYSHYFNYTAYSATCQKQPCEMRPKFRRVDKVAEKRLGYDIIKDKEAGICR